MPEIHYKHIPQQFEKSAAEPKVPVYLIHGQELLCKNALAQVLKALLPESTQPEHLYAPLEGLNENVYQAIEQVNTFSLLGERKIVGLQDAKIFFSKQDRGLILEKAKDAYEKEDLKKAAQNLLMYLEFGGLELQDCIDGNLEDIFGKTNATAARSGWLDQVISFARENRMRRFSGNAPAKALEEAIQKGFPKGNHLVITSDVVDKRRRLYKTIKEKGWILDCSVPLGNRMADKKAQESVLQDQARDILAASGKTMDRRAYAAVVERTGFDLRTFANNLDKLISFAGDRKQITIEDVQAVLQRTRTDPIYELTNALADRDAAQSLFYLESLISNGMHPLQAFAAMTNQIRRLLRIKGFVESTAGAGWHAGISYDQFRRGVVPAIIEDDTRLLGWLQEWADTLKTTDESAEAGDEGTSRKGKRKRQKIETDLQILKTPNNPYPVYQSFLKSEHFSCRDLQDALACLGEVDVRLKSSGQDPKIVLEQVILKICKA